MSFSCQKGEYDRFFNRLNRPVEESRTDRQPDRCRSTQPVSISGLRGIEFSRFYDKESRSGLAKLAKIMEFWNQDYPDSLP